MDDDELLERLSSLRQWRSGEQRAPHKPLLLLLALGNVQRGGQRLRPFTELEVHLARLLDDYGPPRRNQQPRYPFWRLQSDGLWEVTGPSELMSIPRGDDPPLALLRNPETRGGLPAEIDQRLRDDPALLAKAAQLLLDEHFAPSLHEDLLLAVGLEIRLTVVGRPGRDPQFRVEVLRAYEYACAMCGYDGQLETVSVGVEAAHVRWWAQQGPDTLDNALALCSLHHRALDRGALGVDDDHRVLVSSLFRGGETTRTMVLDLQHRPLRRPQPGLPGPADDYLDWHRREVFRGPPRMEALAAEGP